MHGSKPSASDHKRQLKAEQNRRYYQRRHHREGKRKNRKRIFPLELLDTETEELALDVDSLSPHQLRTLGFKGVIALIAANIVRRALKEKPRKRKRN